MLALETTGGCGFDEIDWFFQESVDFLGYPAKGDVPDLNELGSLLLREYQGEGIRGLRDRLALLASWVDLMIAAAPTVYQRDPSLLGLMIHVGVLSVKSGAREIEVSVVLQSDGPPPDAVSWGYWHGNIVVARIR